MIGNPALKSYAGYRLSPVHPQKDGADITRADNGELLYGLTVSRQTRKRHSISPVTAPATTTLIPLPARRLMSDLVRRRFSRSVTRAWLSFAPYGPEKLIAAGHRPVLASRRSAAGRGDRSVSADRIYEQITAGPHEQRPRQAERHVDGTLGSALS
jgi:hypothetical protein